MSTLGPDQFGNLLEIPLKGALEAGLYVQSVERASEETREVAARRRIRNRRVDAKKALLRVVERRGVLELEEVGRGSVGHASRRRAARSGAIGGQVVHEIEFERLGRNEVTAALAALDDKLTPRQGLFAWKSDRLVAHAAPAKKGRVLLFLHGTFSEPAHLLDELAATEPGRRLLARAGGHYDEILSFGHRTLSVGPMLNARELALLFSDSAAEIDVVAHSRGGLVARWWADVFERRPGRVRRAVLVGAPLEGTSLASPARLRASLNLVATFGRALAKGTGVASAAVPFLAFASGVFQIVSSVASLGGRTPAIDAALAMIPGLAAMQRISNSAEIRSLQSGPDARDRYYAVHANFESPDTGWAFWKLFRGIPTRAADLATDFVFDGSNDLVVDTVSMDRFAKDARLPKERRLDFGTTHEVHHLSYFRHPKTVAFLDEVLR